MEYKNGIVLIVRDLLYTDAFNVYSLVIYKLLKAFFVLNRIGLEQRWSIEQPKKENTLKCEL